MHISKYDSPAVETNTNIDLSEIPERISQQNRTQAIRKRWNHGERIFRRMVAQRMQSILFERIKATNY
jgi:hypothetical protein